MAEHWRRTRTVKTVEYVLHQPTNWAEVTKVLAALDNELPAGRRSADSTVTVTATETEIIFSYKDDEVTKS